MGNGSSKPEQHIFNADAPVRLSQSVIDSLQNNRETDSSRAQDLELKIQSRVNQELVRLRDSQAKQLDSLTASLTTDAPKDAPAASSASTRDPNTLAAHLSSPFYHDHGASADGATKPGNSDSSRSHDSVNHEIMDLRAKLDARKKLDKVNPEVEKAKERLVSCLRTHDRRPLDCWQEVEQFKAEVGKLEQAFIQKAGR